ncbi:MAG: hypothetical protein ACXWTX_03995 [Gallionella sp.]
MSGRLYGIQPEDREPIEVTFYSEWFSDGFFGIASEHLSENEKLTAFNNASLTDKAVALMAITQSWQKSLGAPVIDTRGFNDLHDMIRKVGFDNVMNLIIFHVLTLGFDVYVGSDNTFIEIYNSTDWE